MGASFSGAPSTASPSPAALSAVAPPSDPLSPEPAAAGRDVPSIAIPPSSPPPDPRSTFLEHLLARGRSDPRWLREEVFAIAGSSREDTARRLTAIRAGQAELGFAEVAPLYEAWFRVPPEALGPQGTALQEGALRLLSSFANLPGQDNLNAFLGRLAADPLAVLPPGVRGAAATAFFAHASLEAGRNLLLRLDPGEAALLHDAVRAGLARRGDREEAASLARVLDGPTALPPPPPPRPEDG